MSQIKKIVRIPAKPKRPEPAPADYCDEISDTVLNDIRRTAASKDPKDEKWETIDGPAW